MRLPAVGAETNRRYRQGWWVGRGGRLKIPRQRTGNSRSPHNKRPNWIINHQQNPPTKRAGATPQTSQVDQPQTPPSHHTARKDHGCARAEPLCTQTTSKYETRRQVPGMPAGTRAKTMRKTTATRVRDGNAGEPPTDRTPQHYKST